MKKISSENIWDGLKKIQSDGLWKQLDDSHKRKYTLFTGAKGAEMIHEAISDVAVVQPVREELNELLELEIIDANKHESLMAMVNSKDVESFELARDLINIKREQHGDRIQSRRPFVHFDRWKPNRLDISNECSIEIQNTLREGEDSFIMLPKPEVEMVWPEPRVDFGYMGLGSKPCYHPRIMVPRPEGTGSDIT